MLAWGLALFALAGCDSPPPPVDVAPEVVVPSPTVSEPQVRAVVADGSAPSVALHFRGVGNLHQNYFSEPRVVGPLGVGLGACLKDDARVRVSYDSENRIGYIALLAAPRDLGACLPQRDGDGWDVRPLNPVGQALASYRDGVAAAFDIRVASFKVEVELLRGATMCTLRIGGQFPPTGESWSPCVAFEGNTECQGADANDGASRLAFSDPKLSRKLSRCFDH